MAIMAFSTQLAIEGPELRAMAYGLLLSLKRAHFYCLKALAGIKFGNETYPQGRGMTVMRYGLLLGLFMPLSLLAGDARVFVKSDPSGAEVFLKKVEGEGEGAKVSYSPLNKKTPALIPLAISDQPYLLVLRMANYKDHEMKVLVSKTGILKPDPAKLLRTTRQVDVLYEHGDGWQVFIDGKPVKDTDGKPAKTPCTIELPSGAKQISLAKKGFNDQSVRQQKDQKQITFARKVWKGNSKLLSKTAVKNDPHQAFNKLLSKLPAKFRRQLKTFNKSAYLLVAENMDWFAARDYCKQLSGQLVCIETKEEQQFLSKNYGVSFQAF